jgi:hypothetical protein
MTSGYMFTRIRNTPFMGGDGSWIAGGFQNQFGQEVQVISVVCASVTFFVALILLIHRRRHAGIRVPHAHYGHPVPDHCPTSTIPDLFVEHHHHARLFYPHRPVQGQK